MDDEMFKKVVLNSRTSNPCSPREPGPNFLGILIDAPKRVSFKRGQKAGATGAAFAVIPICGYYMIEMRYQKKFQDILKAMRLVAVDRERGFELTGKVMHPMPTMPNVQKPHLTEEQIENMATGGYFNPNLAEQVPLPEWPGMYDVHVEVGERDSEDFIKSNIVNIIIVEEKD